MKKLQIACTLLALTMLVGCAANQPNKPLPKGAITQTDASLYDSLVTARGVIDGACQPGTSVVTNNCALKPELAPYKAQVNAAIHSWNLAEGAYTTYHAALKNGGTPDPATVTATVAQAVADAAGIVTAITGGK